MQRINPCTDVEIKRFEIARIDIDTRYGLIHFEVFETLYGWGECYICLPNGIYFQDYIDLVELKDSLLEFLEEGFDSEKATETVPLSLKDFLIDSIRLYGNDIASMLIELGFRDFLVVFDGSDTMIRLFNHGDGGVCFSLDGSYPTTKHDLSPFGELTYQEEEADVDYLDNPNIYFYQFNDKYTGVSELLIAISECENSSQAMRLLGVEV